MKIETTIPQFQTAKVLVYGDIILDRYWYGDVSRISPEAPVPVVHVQRRQSQPGGAANVALNIAALGAQVDLFGIVGKDPEAIELQEILHDKKINLYLLAQAENPTITKLRVVGQNQQLVRMDFEKLITEVDENYLYQRYIQQLAHAEVIILSDYAKGTLHKVEKLITTAKQKNKIVLVDPKHKDLNRYRGADLVTPNRKEFEVMMGPCRDQQEIIDKALIAIERSGINAILITLGKDGMLLVQKHQQPYYIPTRAREVYDVTGAGDTVIATVAASLAAGSSLERASELANFAAGIVIRKFGTATVSVPELRRALHHHNNSHLGVLTEEELCLAVADAREHRETIVMTNGCFDILHAGHIEYLQKAKNLGDRLIVAVNDDASVRRLKGSTRPFNKLVDRLDLLAGLRSVDWVVPFSEETPARLIATILPDILVKGADYAIHEIAGGDEVLAHGGQVKTIPLREGYSTSKLIAKILQHEVLA